MKLVSYILFWLLVAFAASAHSRGLDLSGSLQGAGGIGGLLAMTDGSGNNYFYHQDGIGNVTALMDGREQIAYRATYDPFNRIIRQTGNSGLGLFGASGQLYDQDTRLLHHKRRVYSPELMRWLSNDPRQEHGGINLYRYVGNNPISNIDPLGLDFFDWLGQYSPAVAQLDAGRDLDAFAKRNHYKNYDDLKESLYGDDAIRRTKQESVEAISDIAQDAANLYLVAATSVVPTATGARCTSAFAERFLNANRIKSGLKADSGHRAASFLTKEQLESGKTFIIKGRDGVERTLLQTKETLDNKSGIFEYILDPLGNVTHQRFKESGIINGIPN